MIRLLKSATLTLLLVNSAIASAADTSRVVVVFKDRPAMQQAFAKAKGNQRVFQASGKNVEGDVLEGLQGVTSRSEIATFAVPAGVAVDAVLAKLRQDPRVLHANQDQRMYASSFSPEPLGANQWSFGSTGGAIDARNAGFAGFRDVLSRFDGTGVRVAILDTGRTPGTIVAGGRAVKETTANVLPGYDFNSNPQFSGDGDGIDPDETDPGDQCGPNKPNSWHGTAMESIISSQINGVGIAGAAPGVSIQHVRVLGGCASFFSDLANGIVWAAGGVVDGVPVNPTPAHVINMSLSGGGVITGECDPALQRAIDFAISRGVVLVSATNNFSTYTGRSMPAACPGVIGVGASTRNGDLWVNTNRDPSLALYAPGGGACANSASRVFCDDSAIPSLGNDTARAAWNVTNSRIQFWTGSSNASALVAAAAALLKQARPDATPAQIRGWLVDGARAHPAHSICNTPQGDCGTGGLLDIRRSIELAQAGSSAISLSINVPARTSLFRGAGSTEILSTVQAQSAVTYAWSVISGGGTLDSTTAPTARLSWADRRATHVVQLVATDAQGRTATRSVELQVEGNGAWEQPAPVTMTVGQPVEVTLRTTDPDPEKPLLFAVSGIDFLDPSSFDPTTFQVRGTDGSHGVRINPREPGSTTVRFEVREPGTGFVFGVMELPVTASRPGSPPPPPPAANNPASSGGGCSVAGREGPMDPTLLVLAALSALLLVRRRRFGDNA